MIGRFKEADSFRADDPIARLIVHYFFPCDFCHLQYLQISNALKRQRRRTPWRASQQIAFQRFWLAALYTVIEGYKQTEIQDSIVDQFLLDEKNVNGLRLLRNGTFHYQRSADKLVQFYELIDGLVWAEALHKAFDSFFHSYRMENLMRNLMAMREDSRDPGLPGER